MIQFDCHAHVYEQVMAVHGARYSPRAPAPLGDWLDHQARFGLKGGVIVQVSFLGTDNSQMCAALARLDRSHFAGVGVVDLDIREGDLDRLVRAGMRGVRWNLVRGAQIPEVQSEVTQRFFAKLRARDLHLEIHLEGPRLAPHLAALSDQGVPLVVDHFGLPSVASPRNDPLLRAVGALADRTAVHVKFSAHYRVPFDLRPHADQLRTLLPDSQIVWGSDWPHTQHERCTSYAEAWTRRADWPDLSDGTAARTLYGIG